MNRKKYLALLLLFTIFTSVLPQVASAADVTKYDETKTNLDLSKTITWYPVPILKSENNSWAPYDGLPTNQHTLSTKLVDDLTVLEAGKQDDVQSNAYVQFPTQLPSLEGGLLTKATFIMIEENKPTSWDYYGSVYKNTEYTVHGVEKQWDPETATWQTQPELSSPIASTTGWMGTDSGYYNWDVTSLIAGWYVNQAQIHDIAVTSILENSLRRFHKGSGHSTKTTSPRLLIQYSPKPSISSAVAYDHGAKSGKGHVNLQWYSVPGAVGYKVLIFDGKSYIPFDVGNVTNWSTANKGIWPTTENIENGHTQLKTDGSGTELSDDPSRVYLANGGNKASHYSFKIVAYNQYGESMSDEINRVIPDTTPPAQVKNVSVHPDKQNFTISWTPVDDANSYRIHVGTFAGGRNIVNGAATTEAAYTVPTTLEAGTTYFVEVISVDSVGNASSPVTWVGSAANPFDAMITSYSVPFELQAGVPVTLSVTLINKGAKAWTAGTTFTFQDPVSAEIALPYEVKTGESITLSHSWTPNVIGQFSIKGQMKAGTLSFGDILSEVRTVKDTIKPNVMLHPILSNENEVTITGSLSDATLESYELRVKGLSDSNWKMISTGLTAKSNEVLGVWNTENVPTGIYQVQLIARDKAGNEQTDIQIIEIKQWKKDATVEAITAISMLPSVEKITLQDETLVKNARALVELVKTYGAKDSDISNLEVLKKAEERIFILSQSGWKTIEGKKYYVSPTTGLSVVGWLKYDGKWYFFDSTGMMKTGWVKDGSKWYYLNGDGSMHTGWLKDGGKWYYLNSDGSMRVGWLKYGSSWYYLDGNGAMATGWRKVNNKWYYFYSGGNMAFNTTIQGYRLGSDGAWIK
ncbi:DNRLRE domain-containing protein [Bacillus timonensis]|nr:DNRLRE domain-containing protein [Bacillus timonensis]